MENNIKLSITSPVGATLNTSGKYCDGDIEVIPYLQEKTVTESGEVLPDEGYAGLSKVMVDVQNSGVDTSKDTVTAETMLAGITAHNASGEQIEGTIPTYDGAMQDGLESYPKFQEKTVTKNGEVVPDEGFDGLSKVTVNVPNTGGGATEKPIVGYLYNGKILPFLPEYDKEAYPYAYMYTTLGAIALYLTSTKTQIAEAGESKRDKHTEGFNYLGYIYANGAWSYMGEGSKNDGEYTSSMNDLEFIWSNHDVFIYGTDEIYLAASEPVPIYKKAPIIVTPINYNSFPSLMEGQVVKLSDEPLSLSELSRTVVYRHHPEEPGFVALLSTEEFLRVYYSEKPENVQSTNTLTFREEIGINLVCMNYEDNIVPFLYNVPSYNATLGLQAGLYIPCEMLTELKITLIINHP